MLRAIAANCAAVNGAGLARAGGALPNERYDGTAGEPSGVPLLLYILSSRLSVGGCVWDDAVGDMIPLPSSLVLLPILLSCESVGIPSDGAPLPLVLISVRSCCMVGDMGGTGNMDGDGGGASGTDGTVNVDGDCTGDVTADDGAVLVVVAAVPAPTNDADDSDDNDGGGDVVVADGGGSSGK